MEPHDWFVPELSVLLMVLATVKLSM